MIEEGLREVLALEKEEQIRLTQTQIEGEEIKKQGELEAKRILEQGKSEFLQRLKNERDELEAKLKSFEQDLFERHRQDLVRLENFYRERKDALLQEIIDWVLE